MATYIELYNLYGDNTLRNRCATALIVSAMAMLSAPTPTTAQKKFAIAVFQDPTSWGQKALAAALALNKTATVGQINAATDTALQANIDSIAQSFADALA